MQQIQSSQMSPKYQTSIPSYIRKKLNLEPGDRINWRIIYRNNKAIAIAEPTSKNWSQETRGLGKHLWEHIDIKSYINALRTEWEPTK
ncbi:MAG: hypothetical protein O3B87_05665 [bacterium]|nr:hypothetical protein [bacterium]